MTPAEYVKSIGLNSLKEMSKISTVRTQTLDNWWNDNPQRFKAMARGCVAIKHEENTMGIIDIKDCLQEILILLREKK